MSVLQSLAVETQTDDPVVDLKTDTKLEAKKTSRKDEKQMLSNASFVRIAESELEADTLQMYYKGDQLKLNR